jgi:hypothetical protein
MQDATDTARSDSYLDLHLNLKLTLRTSSERNFPIVNIPFICGTIPVAPAYGIYISQLIRFSMACGFCVLIMISLIDGCC